MRTLRNPTMHPASLHLWGLPLWGLCLAVLPPRSIVGSEPETPSVRETTEPESLQSARQSGRNNSRMLRQANSEGGILAAEASAIPEANLGEFQRYVSPILNQSCLPCHGPQRSEGQLRIDELSPDLIHGTDSEKWREVYNAVVNSEMPPEDEPDCQLSDEDRARIIDWISQEMSKAPIAVRDKSQPSSFRRMTKYEYRNALEDLLSVSLSTSNRLPQEVASEDGFKNSSALLQMSAMQFETHRDIGLDALHRAIVLGDRPVPVRYRISMLEQIGKPPSNKKKPRDSEFFDKDDSDYDKKRRGRVLLNLETGQGIAFQEGSISPITEPPEEKPPEEKPTEEELGEISPVVLVLPASNEVKWNLDRFLPDLGTMRVRIRAGRSNNNPEQHAALRLIFSAHTSNDANFSQVISQHDIPVIASADEPECICFDIQLQDIQRNPFRKLSTTFPRRDEFLSIRNVSNAKGKDDPLCVWIKDIEITAPYYESWPPKSHKNIFLSSSNFADEAVYGREVLSKFLRKAWRRSVSPAELEPFMDLFSKYRPEFSSFEAAMTEVLAAVLASPEFLYITQREASAADEMSQQTISHIELASRLSFFLWSSIPDEELLDLAEQGALADPSVLNAQVIRMLADPRSSRLADTFVPQWLGTDGLDSVTHITDGSLKESMREEPIAFFREVLSSNSSCLDFIHSPYVVINETLANHYRIAGVSGPDFRKVALEESAHRGGILTNAAILAMNSDGKDSHPLKRGVWMLKRILQDPPPPPPPNVPEVDLTDPEILKMSLKDRIADHRNKPACVSCHAKIDPWGIAFENFDAMGKFRTEIQGQEIDAKSLLLNKQELDGIEGLKRYLLAHRQDQLCRSMVDKLCGYALGRPMSSADRAQVDRITLEFRKQDDRLGDLIQLIVSSNLFKSR